MLSTITRRSALSTAAGALCIPLAHAMQEAQPKPPVGLSALLDGTGMVRVPAGEFQMGSTAGNPDERPVHRVRITRPFEIAKHEVTQAQWETVMRNAHTGPDAKTNFSHFQGLNLPVESVTWEDAQEFLKRLNARDTAFTYRLPTEAEWEYACQGGPRKAAAPILDAAGWYGANSKQQTQPVGLKAPNALGLFDMLGNVAEWVQDWYAGDYYGSSPSVDPQGPGIGSYRVYRGGCWFDSPRSLRAAYRGFDLPSNKTYNVGFRVVRVRNE